MKNLFVIPGTFLLLLTYLVPITKMNSQEINSVKSPTNLLKKSKSFKLITNDTPSNDASYLLWGDGLISTNSGTKKLKINTDIATNVITYTDILEKKWKLSESDIELGINKISFDSTLLSSLPSLSGNDAYVMVVADNSTFSSNVKTVALSTNQNRFEVEFNFTATQFFTFGVAHETVAARSLNLNGTDDVLEIGNANNLPNQFSLMFWVKSNGIDSNSSSRTIASKFNGTTGYKIYLSNDNKINISWAGGTTLTSNTILPNEEWHNIEFTFNGSKIYLYIDGVFDSSTASNAPINTNNTFVIGAEYRSESDIRNYFKGEIDEYRLWNTVLNSAQIHFIINQEILEDNTKTKGSIIPNSITKNEIGNLDWANLIAYYSMNSFIGTYINDDSNNNNRGFLNINDGNIEFQTAPMPYVTIQNGSWNDPNSWENGTMQPLPYSRSIANPSNSIEWNIVQTNNNITSTGNKILLALFVANNTYSASNNSKVEITHYFKLDGKLDLVGKSQLIQVENSDYDSSSIGIIERDQEGQSNKYNFNYWSSPVSTSTNSTNNSGFTIASVLKDGTNPNEIQNINWTNDINSIAGNPITLSNYWLFKFQNLSNNYANWSIIGQNGILMPGEGFTMKGSNASTPTQNYTFVGKPNNGTISCMVSPNNLNLCGNPYPSSIDANAFITDNINTIKGTLYFWEHFEGNNSHNSELYKGGYATRTLVGGTPPVYSSQDFNANSSNRMPNRFIPVGQGFFVKGTTTGGEIVFKNSQRLFVKETNTQSNSLFKTNPIVNASENEFDNTEDTFSDEPFMKLRLGFDSSAQFHRQLLLGYMNEHATSTIDNGYDAVMMENQPDDMCFIKENQHLNILGEGYFNSTDNYPLGVTTSTNGIVKFSIDATENVPQDQPIFIHDAVTGFDYNIKENALEIQLAAGNYDNRFSLRFIGTNLGTSTFESTNGLSIVHSQSDHQITITNHLNSNIESVILYNILGQCISTMTEDNLDTELHLEVPKINSGNYIIKVNTDNGSYSKKIAILD
jgi:hypothetical protein